MPIVVAFFVMLKDFAVWVLGVLFVKAVVKIIIAFGFGIVTYSGLDGIFEILKGKFTDAYYQLPLTTLQLLELAGFLEAINIIFSGVSFLIGSYATEQFLRMIDK